MILLYNLDKYRERLIVRKIEWKYHKILNNLMKYSHE